jgi:hypothetical protein
MLLRPMPSPHCEVPEFQSANVIHVRNHCTPTSNCERTLPEGRAELIFAVVSTSPLPFPSEFHCLFSLAPGESLTPADFTLAEVQVVENGEMADPSDLGISTDVSLGL